MDKQGVFREAKSWVLEAGKHIRDNINEPLHIETKSNADDLVTQMDQETEEFFADRIRSTYPSHRVFGEEGFGDDVRDLDGIVWIVDPIDGTMNFVHQQKNFAISIGIYEDGIGEIGIIYDVMEDVLYTAVKGEGAYRNGEPLPEVLKNRPLEKSIFSLNTTWLLEENRRVEAEGIRELVKTLRSTRSYGSAALEFAFVAEGLLDGYVTMSLMPWDVAAGKVILEEVGGVVTAGNGSELSMVDRSSVCATRANIHDEVVKGYIRLK
ncbi:inositol monophosphatase family protein [Salimicrobium halophilum]|uniref:inositol-phosphate phosphatase n=1 Tax=Salimicrobium halophilum TaxID=86666 RepID=A0A1G8QI42_9BACI|nr:inositol monophosphatase family protein [Salimicrobium halophilum]SDJ04328.1 myo-inositol-1(or 4)-monophosphatase [Salimicrobium halophilum]